MNKEFGSIKALVAYFDWGCGRKARITTKDGLVTVFVDGEPRAHLQLKNPARGFRLMRVLGKRARYLAMRGAVEGSVPYSAREYARAQFFGVLALKRDVPDPRLPWSVRPSEVHDNSYSIFDNSAKNEWGEPVCILAGVTYHEAMQYLMTYGWKGLKA